MHVDSWNTNKSLTCIQFLLHWCSKFAFSLNILRNDHSVILLSYYITLLGESTHWPSPLTEVSFSFLHHPPSSSKVEKAPDTWGTLLNMTGLWCAIKTSQKTIKQTCRQRAHFKQLKNHIYMLQNVMTVTLHLYTAEKGCWKKDKITQTNLLANWGLVINEF